MKILVVCQHYFPENFAINEITRKLVSFGHEVTVLTGQPNYGFDGIAKGYENVFYETIDGVEVYRVKICPRKTGRLSIIKNYLSFWAHSKKWVRKTKKSFDVVYSMSLSPIISVSAANLYSRKHKVPHLLHCVDLWPESTVVTKNIKYNGLLYRFLLAWSRRIYRNTSEIVIGSQSFKTYFDEVLKIKNKGLTFIPQPALVNGCNEEAIHYEKGTHIIYAGNLGSLQLLDLLLDAAQQLKDRGSYFFHVIGMGSMKDRFLKELKLKNLEDRVIYHGPMPSQKAAAYFVHADALWVSLKNEGIVGKTIPNKLIMYLAFGKPILGVVQGDSKDLLQKAGGAILCDQDSKDIAEKVARFSALSDEEKNMLGNRNKHYFDDNFESIRLIREIERHLLDLIK